MTVKFSCITFFNQLYVFPSAHMYYEGWTFREKIFELHYEKWENLESSNIQSCHDDESKSNSICMLQYGAFSICNRTSYLTS